MKQQKKYILLIVIYILTIITTLYISAVYKNSKKVIPQTTSKYMTEITTKKYEEIKSNLNNYLIENNDALLYIANESEKESKIEKEFYSYVKENSLEDKIIYINVNNLNKNIIDKLNNDFIDDIKLKSKIKRKYPQIWNFSKSKVVSVLEKKEIENIEDIKQFFKDSGEI